MTGPVAAVSPEGIGGWGDGDGKDDSLAIGGGIWAASLLGALGGAISLGKDNTTMRVSLMSNDAYQIATPTIDPSGENRRLIIPW